MQEHEYEIIAEIGQGIALPSNEKYSVMIKIADYVIKTEKPLHAENTYNRWNFRYNQATYKCPYQDALDIGRVYVYLMQGDKPVCYYKEEVSAFLNPNAQWKWVQLNPDLAIGKVTDAHKGGIISFKLSIHDKTRDGPISFD